MIKVQVKDAPGYEDFTAELLVLTAGWPMAVVGFEWEGKREVAVVPSRCLHTMDGEPVTED